MNTGKQPTNNPVALYIHIPFCRQKCGYCSFISFSGREANIPEYLNCLQQELISRLTGQRISTIYIGGGTPSLLTPEQLGDLLATADRIAQIDKNAEITIEANPGTVDDVYLGAIRKLGINRISLGMQSLDDSELALLGRIHTAGEAVEAVNLARRADFQNINIDLIYGIPGQSLKSFEITLSNMAELSPEHISLYPLTLEADTALDTSIKQGKVAAPDSDIAADQYELAEDLLENNGYIHYEISNWAKPGYECRHNLVYWKYLPYLGIGVAAHSFWNGHRIANTSSLEKYLDAFSSGRQSIIEMDEEINFELQISEAIILGLRLAEGVSFEDIRDRFGVNIGEKFAPIISEVSNLGLLEIGESSIRLSRRGRLLGNEVFQRFLPEMKSAK